MQPRVYLIAKIPPTPQIMESQSLFLSYEPEIGGIFFYGNQPLNLTYTHQETIFNNTHPTGITKTKTCPLSTRLNCLLWVNYFSEWSIEGEKLYSGLLIRDYETDTEREDRYFSGLKFDEDTGTWKCTWEKRNWQQFFNSTFYYSQTVELVLNFIDRLGSYFEHEYSSTVN